MMSNGKSQEVERVMSLYCTLLFFSAEVVCDIQIPSSRSAHPDTSQRTKYRLSVDLEEIGLK